DAQAAGQLVRGLEADAPDVGGQAIGVGPHQFHGLVAVGLVDAHGPRGADAVRLEEDHDATDGLLLLPALADALQSARAEPRDLLKEGRDFVDDLQRALAKNGNDFAGEMWADALDQSRAEVLLNALNAVRRRAAQRFGLELLTVLAVLHPAAACLDV